MEKTAVVSKIKKFEHKATDKDFVFGLTFDNKDMGMYHSPTENQSYFVEGKPCAYLIEEKPKKAGGTYFLISVPGKPEEKKGDMFHSTEPENYDGSKVQARLFALVHTKDIVVAGKVDITEFKVTFLEMVDAFDESINKITKG